MYKFLDRAWIKLAFTAMLSRLRRFCQFLILSLYWDYFADVPFFFLTDAYVFHKNFRASWKSLLHQVVLLYQYIVQVKISMLPLSHMLQIRCLLHLKKNVGLLERAGALKAAQTFFEGGRKIKVHTFYTDRCQLYRLLAIGKNSSFFWGRPFFGGCLIELNSAFSLKEETMDPSLTDS